MRPGCCEDRCPHARPPPRKRTVTPSFPGSLQPAFDSQEEVYSAILMELEEANTLFDAEIDIAAEHDILFQGDLSKWQ